MLKLFFPLGSVFALFCWVLVFNRKTAALYFPTLTSVLEEVIIISWALGLWVFRMNLSRHSGPAHTWPEKRQEAGHSWVHVFQTSRYLYLCALLAWLCMLLSLGVEECGIFWVTGPTYAQPHGTFSLLHWAFWLLFSLSLSCWSNTLSSSAQCGISKLYLKEKWTHTSKWLVFSLCCYMVKDIKVLCPSSRPVGWLSVQGFAHLETSLYLSF